MTSETQIFTPSYQSKKKRKKRKINKKSKNFLRGIHDRNRILVVWNSSVKKHLPKTSMLSNYNLHDLKMYPPPPHHPKGCRLHWAILPTTHTIHQSMQPLLHGVIMSSQIYNDEQTNEWMNEWTTEWTNERTQKCVWCLRAREEEEEVVWLQCGRNTFRS